MTTLLRSPPALTPSEIEELQNIVSPSYDLDHEIPDLDASGGPATPGSLSLKDMNTILLRAAVRIRRNERDGEEVLQLSKSQSQSSSVAKLPEPYMDPSESVAKPDGKSLVPAKTRALADRGRTIEDPVMAMERKKKKSKPDSLSSHFGLPRTKVTQELRRDLQLLHMRDVTDPKRMYKKQGSFKIPEYSQVGTIIEGPTEFHSSRLTNAERSNTFVEDALTTEHKSGKLHSKYAELQNQQRKGKKAYYKSLISKRKKPN